MLATNVIILLQHPFILYLILFYFKSISSFILSRNASAEILDVASCPPLSRFVFLDNEDELNVAQPNPIPGQGFVYGTKRGAMRAVKQSHVFRGSVRMDLYKPQHH